MNRSTLATMVLSGSNVAFFLTFCGAICFFSRTCHAFGFTIEASYHDALTLPTRALDEYALAVFRSYNMSPSSSDPSIFLARATSATIRAIGRRPDAAATFDVASSGGGQATQNLLRLKRLSNAPGPEALAALRGEADSFALRLRHHDERLHRRLRPADNAAGDLFDALERVRIEVLGARWMRGVAENLAVAAMVRDRHELRVVPGSESKLPPAAAVACLVRARLADGINSDENQALAFWRTRMPAEFAALAGGLAGRLDDQRAFAQAARRLIEAFGLDAACVDSPADVGDDGNAIGSSQRESRKEEAAATARESKELVRTSPQDSPAGPEDSDASGSGDVNADLLPEGGGEDPGGKLRRAPSLLGGSRADLAEYRIFAPQYDRIVRAEDLCSAAELIRFRRDLDRRRNEVRASVGRYAMRLCHAVMAKAERGWESDLDEGQLDTRRLASVAVDPAQPLAFKRPQDILFRDTVVTLLIDNSGSMRGDPIEVAAIAADVFGETLERCGVAFEILGFTTAAWKGGRCYERWQDAGRPARPGRLNEVQHIIYKSASESWRRARRNLALMLVDNLLKENIDGEALLWAHDRLLARPERRRILIVLSDGEPVDIATLDVNRDDYLGRHLTAVVDHIVRRSPVELFAIGIGPDVGRYYPHAVALESIGDLTLELFAKIAHLLEADLPYPRDRLRLAQPTEKGLFDPADFAGTPVIRGDGARFGPIPGEQIVGVITHH